MKLKNSDGFNRDWSLQDTQPKLSINLFLSYAVQTNTKLGKGFSYFSIDFDHYVMLQCDM